LTGLREKTGAERRLLRELKSKSTARRRKGTGLQASETGDTTVT